MYVKDSSGIQFDKCAAGQKERWQKFKPYFYEQESFFKEQQCAER